MKKILVAYYSRTGMTEKMAEYVAEGVRFSGNEEEDDEDCSPRG